MAEPLPPRELTYKKPSTNLKAREVYPPPRTSSPDRVRGCIDDTPALKKLTKTATRPLRKREFRPKSGSRMPIREDARPNNVALKGGRIRSPVPKGVTLKKLTQKRDVG